MRRRSRATLLLVIVVAAVGLGRWVRTSPGGPAAPPRDPLLSAATDRLDFGETWEDQRFEWVVPVTNRSPGVVRVEKVRTSCGCVVAEPRSFTVPAGATHPLRLTLDLTPKPNERPTRARGFSVEVGLVARAEGGEPAHEGFTLRGRVR